MLLQTNVGNNILIGLLLIVLTSFVHTIVTKLILTFVTGDKLQRLAFHRVLQLELVILILVLATLVEALMWAMCFIWHDTIQEIEPALYFSLVTYTTLGYGDVVLPPAYRLLSAFTATNGVIIFGWSTAIVVASIQKIFMRKNSKND